MCTVLNSHPMGVSVLCYGMYACHTASARIVLIGGPDSMTWTDASEPEFRVGIDGFLQCSPAFLDLGVRGSCDVTAITVLVRVGEIKKQYQAKARDQLWLRARVLSRAAKIVHGCETSQCTGFLFLQGPAKPGDHQRSYRGLPIITKFIYWTRYRYSKVFTLSAP